MTDRLVVVDPGNYTPFYDINLCHALAASGWQVELLTSPHSFESIVAPPDVQVRELFLPHVTAIVRRLPLVGDLPIVRRALKAMSYPLDLIRLDRELAQKPAGLLHVQWALLPSIDAWFWRRWRRRGWTIVYTAHDVGGLSGTTPRMLRRGNRRLFRLADGVFVHSTRDRDRVVRSGVPHERIAVIPQGTPGVFQSPAIETADARRALEIDPARPTVLLFGFLKSYKGLGMLLDSLDRLRARVPNVLALIAGEPMIRVDSWRHAIAGRGLDAHVLWHPSYVPSTRVSLYFAAADVVALPYTAASSSAVLLNAYAHARPVVATNVGGTAEMVRDHETGLLVSPQDAQAFAAALETLLLNRVKREAMGRAAQQYAERHAWPLIADETTKMYRTAMSAARTAR